MPDQLTNLIRYTETVLDVYTDRGGSEQCTAEGMLHEVWLEFLVSIYPSKMPRQSFQYLYKAYTWRSEANEDDYKQMLEILQAFESSSRMLEISQAAAIEQADEIERALAAMEASQRRERLKVAVFAGLAVANLIVSVILLYTL